MLRPHLSRIQSTVVFYTSSSCLFNAGTKMDLASEESISVFTQWANSTAFFPPKFKVATCRSSEAPLSLLELPTSARDAVSSLSFEFRAPHAASGSGEASTSVRPVGDQFGGMTGMRHMGRHSVGWVFPPGVVLPRGKMEAVIRAANQIRNVARIKVRKWSYAVPHTPYPPSPQCLLY